MQKGNQRKEKVTFIRWISIVIFISLFSGSILKSSAQSSLLGIGADWHGFKTKNYFHKWNTYDPGLSLFFIKPIRNKLDGKMQLNGSFPDSISTNNKSNSKSLLLQGNLLMRYHLLNSKNQFQPFIEAGPGISTYRSSVLFQSLVSGGLQWNWNDFYISISSGYLISFSRSLNDHWIYSIGIAGRVGQHKKSAPKKLPEVKHTIVIQEKDTDGDGIADVNDKCPLVPGSAKYSGCPVPDQDGDGINDEEDSCKLIPGLANNHGCPLKAHSIQDTLTTLAHLIYFKTASAELEKSSEEQLNQVAEILLKHQNLSIRIEGHTDSIGTVQYNQELSDHRAQTVRNYLITKGVTSSRLMAQGFGFSLPVESNLTELGRSKNRRVEMKIIKQ